MWFRATVKFFKIVLF